MKRLVAAAGSLALAFAPGLAAAQEPSVAPPYAMQPRWAPPPPPRPLPDRREEEPVRYTQRGTAVELGARTMWIKSAGLDPFSTNDAVTFLSLAASHPILRQKPLYVGVTGGWDFASLDGEARGVATGLVLHRLHAGFEGKQLLGRRLALLARVEPLLVHARAEVRDAGSPGPLVRRPWMFGGEATVGGRYEIGRVGGDDEWPFAKIWVGADVGYAMTTKAKMDVEAQEDPTDPRRTGPVSLPGLSLTGGVMRLVVAASF